MRYENVVQGRFLSRPNRFIALEAGKFGIRHENLVLVRTGDKTEFGQFMYLEPPQTSPRPAFCTAAPRPPTG